MNNRRRVFTGVTALAALVLPALWDIGVFGGNVRTVVPGQVYRSAQLTGGNLESVLATDHIRTVINLRGSSPQEDWYRSELATCHAQGIAHDDVTLSATHLPPPSQLRLLLSDFDHAQYPALFHCQAGADRSGLVGTLYLTIYQDMSLNQAEESQLTWRYGHVAWGKAHAMDDFFRMYRQMNGGLNLRDWITQRYPALYAKSAATVERKPQ